jgi:hypothetical protein
VIGVATPNTVNEATGVAKPETNQFRFTELLAGQCRASTNQFNLTRPPGLGEEGFEWAIEAHDRGLIPVGHRLLIIMKIFPGILLSKHNAVLFRFK